MTHTKYFIYEFDCFLGYGGVVFEIKLRENGFTLNRNKMIFCCCQLVAIGERRDNRLKLSSSKQLCDFDVLIGSFLTITLLLIGRLFSVNVFVYLILHKRNTCTK